MWPFICEKLGELGKLGEFGVLMRDLDKLGNLGDVCELSELGELGKSVTLYLWKKFQQNSKISQLYMNRNFAQKSAT